MNLEDNILIAVLGVIALFVAVWFVRAVIKEANKPDEPKKVKTTEEHILEEIKKGNQERQDSNSSLGWIALTILILLLAKNCGTI